ncbi:TetR/AcrR family transcriptional regulator [Nonomuraea endophytica]|uniref:TetR/AcrR family transcriptional regulator n=1 Tax=Nonomuraea endophytica TaxID=714136 RepID=UPI0037C63A37
MAVEERPKGGLRADARRNRAAIVAATIETLRRSPEASMIDIAAAARVGRMTLYGHFPTRAELLEAALADALERGERTLGALEPEGDPRAALVQLVESSWQLVDDSRALLVAAQKELAPARIRELHERSEARVRELLGRGQREGVFRADLPVSWLLAVTHLVMHGAADEIAAGRLDPGDASRVIRETLLGAFTAGNAA